MDLIIYIFIRIRNNIAKYCIDKNNKLLMLIANHNDHRAILTDFIAVEYGNCQKRIYIKKEFKDYEVIYQ